MKKNGKSIQMALALLAVGTLFKWMQRGKLAEKEHPYRCNAVPGRGCLYQQYPFQPGGKGEGI